MKNEKRFGYAFGILLVAVGLPNAFAESGEPKIKGSIAVHQAKTVEFPKLAKISASQASRAANVQVPGSVLSVGLENEDGFLIYAVNVADEKSGIHEVLIDAGNGKVLSATEKKGGRRSEDEDEEDND
jgi:hypothetical protein